MSRLYWCRISSPLGPLTIVSSEKGLCRIILPQEPRQEMEEWAGTHVPDAELVESTAINQPFISELNRYFDRTLERFESPLDVKGSDFQVRVWTELRRIPYGHTVTYGELARRIGSPQARQAVGRANGANPLPIVIPCHRVVGSRDRLRGYGGGIAVKEFLLRLEGVLLV